MNTEGALVASNFLCFQSLVNGLGQRSNALSLWILTISALAEGEILPHPGFVDPPDSTVRWSDAPDICRHSEKQSSIIHGKAGLPEAQRAGSDGRKQDSPLLT